MPRRLLPILMLLILLVPAAAHAEIPEDKIKIGVLQDLPGPFASETGNGGIVAAQMAASRFETQYLRGDAEILPHVSRGGMHDDLQKVREWLDDEHVAAVLSSAPSAVNRQIARMVEKRHATLLIAAVDADMGGVSCAPDAVVWGAGPTARARALVGYLVPRGDKQWYLAAEQTSAGLAEQSALQQAVSDAGGKVVGTLNHPVGEADLHKNSGKIIQSGAQVLALAESGDDLVAAMRTARLAGLSAQMTVTAPYAQVSDVDDAGPEVAEGIVVTAPFYWDTNVQTRRFALEWSKRMRDKPVTENAAEVYAATLSFLHAAKAVDDISADKVLPQLRRAPIKDTLFGTVTLRKDGRAVYDMGVYQVNRPDQVRHRWAYFDPVASIPGNQVFPPSTCNGGGQGK